jgi:hypothetical protein
MHLTLTQAGTESLQIEADDNILAEIETRVVNGKLDIYYRDTTGVSYRPTQPVRIHLSMKEIQAVSVSGGGILETDSISGNHFELDLSGGSTADIGSLDVEAVLVQISGGGEIRAGSIGARDLDIDLSGASDARIDDLATETLRLANSGGGVASIAGATATAEVEMSGGGDFDAENLQVVELVINASGGGSATVWVINRLDADLSGGSSLSYYGQPEIVNRNTSGGSSIESLGSR